MARVISIAKDADGKVLACAVEDAESGVTATLRANERVRQQLEDRKAGLEPEMDDPDA